ncbi:MAG: hypothetical protein ACKOSQ_04900 [Planctomycetaceae bacterium]
MTASSPLERRARPAAWLARVDASPDDVSGLVIRVAGTSAAAAAAGCGAMLAARRLAGAIEPAGPTLLLAATAVGAALALAADAARGAGGARGLPLTARAGLALAVAGLAPLPWAAQPAGWIVTAVAALAVVAISLRLPLRRTGERPVPEHRAVAGRTRSPRRSAPRGRDSDREPQAGLVRQRFERRELPGGGERVRGRVVVVVPAGAKTGYGHLGFCPAFAATPGVEVTTAYDGVEATVLAAEVLPWGVRVECRLAEAADEQLEIPVDLVAGADAS